MNVIKAASVGIEFDQEAQKQLAVPLGKRENLPNAATKVAEVLVENGVTVAFGAPGGHIWALFDGMSRIGIRMVTFGHEQNGTYAAEAYAQVSRKPGVVFATAGPGMLNTIAGVNQAFLSNTPMVLLLGAHDPDADGRYLELQEGYATQMMGSITKSVHRVVISTAIKQHLIRGFQLAQTAPRAPVALEMPLNLLITNLEGESKIMWGTKAKDQSYQPNWAGDHTGRPFSAGPGEPADVARAIQLIQAAKAPVFLLGDGATWCDAGPELEELVSLLKVPFGSKRLARGLVSDDHPCAVRGKVPYAKEADLLVTWSVKIGAFDGYGSGWPPIIQIVEAPHLVQTFMETPAAIVGNLKSIARAMIDHIKANNIQPPAIRDAWLAKLKQANHDAAESRRKKAQYYGFEHPRYRKFNICHYGYLAQATADFLETNYQSRVRVMIDGFTMSDYAPPMLKATRPAQILSASEQGGVGHGIGMAIGAYMAQREQGDTTPILALMGDSGMGNAGPDIEVAARHKLPIVFMVTNNDGWMPGMKYIYYGEKWQALGPQDRPGMQIGGVPGHGQERIKNDWAAVARGLGLHAERVERHEDYLPALQRAFQSAEAGKPALLDCIMDKRLENRVVTTDYTLGFAHIPYDELPPIGKAWRKENLSWIWPALTDEQTEELKDPWEPVGNSDELE